MHIGFRVYDGTRTNDWNTVLDMFSCPGSLKEFSCGRKQRNESVWLRGGSFLSECNNFTTFQVDRK